MSNLLRPHLYLPSVTRGPFIQSFLSLTLCFILLTALPVSLKAQTSDDASVTSSIVETEETLVSPEPQLPVQNENSAATSVESTNTELTNTQPKTLLNKKISPQKERISLSDTSNWAVVLMSLLGIVVSILLVAWIAKRFTGLSAMNGKDMRVVGAISLGARERVAIVDVKGEQFLLGVTSQNISFLHRFDDAPITTAKPNSGEFAQKLQAILSSSLKGETLDAAMKKSKAGSAAADLAQTKKEAGHE